MKKKLFLVFLLVSTVVRADLKSFFGTVCKDIQKNAQTLYSDFKAKTEQFLANVLTEITKPMRLDLIKFFSLAGKMKTDVGTLKVDIDQLKSQIGENGSTLQNAKNIIDAIDTFEDEVKALKGANPPYSTTELITAITGVPSAIEWLWGGRSKQVEAHFKKMLAQYSILHTTVPKLDIQRIGERTQGLIFELVTIMDNVTDMRKATGDIGDEFIPNDLTTDFRALREDFAKLSTRVGTLAAYKSYIIGGPLSNTELAKKVGTMLITNIFNVGSITSQLATMKQQIEHIKRLTETLKQEGKMVEDMGKTIQEEANLQNLKNRIKNKVTGTSNILHINCMAKDELHRTIVSIRLNTRNTILLALTMLEQVTAIIEHANTIGQTTNSMMGGNFVQPAALSSLQGMVSDLKSIRVRTSRMHTNLAKKLPNI